MGAGWLILWWLPPSSYLSGNGTHMVRLEAYTGFDQENINFPDQGTDDFSGWAKGDSNISSLKVPGSKAGLRNEDPTSICKGRRDLKGETTLYTELLLLKESIKMELSPLLYAEQQPWRYLQSRNRGKTTETEQQGAVAGTEKREQVRGNMQRWRSLHKSSFMWEFAVTASQEDKTDRIMLGMITLESHSNNTAKLGGREKNTLRANSRGGNHTEQGFGKMN